MNKLFIPFDFSASADNALTYAIGLAKALKASITVFHVFDVPVPAGYEDASLTYNMAIANEEKERLKQRIETMLETFKEDFYLGTSNHIKFEVEVRRTGLEEGVADYLKLTPHNLVVMGTKGLNGWEEAVDETNTSLVSNVVNASLLVVPQKAQYQGIRHTVYGSNFDRKDSVILDELRDFLAFFGGHITCVHVRTQADPGNKDFEKMEHLEALFIDTPESEVKFEVIASDSVEQGLFALAKDINADLIAVMPQEHGILGTIFHKSVTKQLTHHTDMPLLIVRK